MDNEGNVGNVDNVDNVGNGVMLMRVICIT